MRVNRYAGVKYLLNASEPNNEQHLINSIMVGTQYMVHAVVGGIILLRVASRRHIVGESTSIAKTTGRERTITKQ